MWNVSLDTSVIMPSHGHVIYVLHEWTNNADKALAAEVSPVHRQMQPPLFPSSH